MYVKNEKYQQQEKKDQKEMYQEDVEIAHSKPLTSTGKTTSNLLERLKVIRSNCLHGFGVRDHTGRPPGCICIQKHSMEVTSNGKRTIYSTRYRLRSKAEDNGKDEIDKVLSMTVLESVKTKCPTGLFLQWRKMD